MTIKVLQVINAKALDNSIGEFSKKYNLGWVDLEAAANEVLGELEAAINNNDGDLDTHIEPQVGARDERGYVVMLSLDDLAGVEVGTEEIE